MKKLISSIAIACALAPALAACQSTGATGTSGGSVQAGAYTAPRLPGTDKPDLNGVWQVLNSANYNIEAHPAQAALQLRPGPYVPVPAAEVVALGAVGAVPAGVGIVLTDAGEIGGTIPYTADALAMRDENKANYLERDPEVKCYLPGIPRANYMQMPFQIFQSDKAFFFAYEYAGAVRNVFLDDPGEAPIPSWMGQSYGTWDGDTFVIEVTGQGGETWMDRAGNQLSEMAVVTERWTRTGENTMRYEATIEDEVNLTKPMKIAFNLYKRTGEDAQLQQFKCVEFVEELMYGHLRKNPLEGPALERARREAEERGENPAAITPWVAPN
jgi:hypothetical protein